MDLARAPRRARLTARKKGSGYENVTKHDTTLVNSFNKHALKSVFVASCSSFVACITALHKQISPGRNLPCISWHVTP